MWVIFYESYLNYFWFQKERIEELQNNLQALIDITELLIQHVHIVTAIPSSFINQLRRFNDIKMADNSKVNWNKLYLGFPVNKLYNIAYI